MLLIFLPLLEGFRYCNFIGDDVVQVNSGINYLFNTPGSVDIQKKLTISISSLAIIPVTYGLDKGIKRLSELNLLLAILFIIFILVTGSTIFLLQTFIQNISGYLSAIVDKAFNLCSCNQTDWLGGWTIFYWS